MITQRRNRVPARFAEKYDTPMKNIRMDALIVRKITQPKNARLGKLLVSCVKEPHTTPLSVTFTPWCNKLFRSRKKERKKPSEKL